MKLTSALLLIVFALSGSSVIAAPAPWYKWRNIVDRTTICAQLTPGDAYLTDNVPYKDAQCKKTGMPG